MITNDHVVTPKQAELVNQNAHGHVKEKMSPNANELVLNKAVLFSVQYCLSLLIELSELYRRVSKCCI